MNSEFYSIIRPYDIKLAFFIPHNLKSFIKVGKDALDKFNHISVVYKISCNNCDATYVGQTKRQLKTRLQEQKNDSVK